MTMEILERILKDNNIPKDVHFMSDSGWECDPTEMDGVFYNKLSNTIVFTQGGRHADWKYEKSEEWERLYDEDSETGFVQVREFELAKEDYLEKRSD